MEIHRVPPLLLHTQVLQVIQNRTKKNKFIWKKKKYRYTNKKQMKEENQVILLKLSQVVRKEDDA